MRLGQPSRSDLVTEDTTFSVDTTYGPFNLRDNSTFSLVYSSSASDGGATLTLKTGITLEDGSVVGSEQTVTVPSGAGEYLLKPNAADTHFEALTIKVASGSDLSYLSLLVY